MKACDRTLDRSTNPTSEILHAEVPGETIYAHTPGVDSINFGAEASPRSLQLNSLYWTAPMTKFATAVAAVQLIEKGVLNLNMDVKWYVEELEGVRQWSTSQGRTARTFCGSMEGFAHPLLSQTGTSWDYGAGLDLAGVLIKRITGIPLSKCMQDNIFSRFEASCILFLYPNHQPKDNTLPPLLGMAYRTASSNSSSSSKATNSPSTKSNPRSKPKSALKPGPIILSYPLTYDLGGIALFSALADFASLLASLLRNRDRLFSKGKESVDLLLAPHMGFEQMKRAFGVGVNSRSNTVGQVEDIPGRRARGSAGLRGFAELSWGIAGALFTQLMPPSERGFGRA
ncbi:beta-lactamase/transpeptidase-like protein [Aspergillus recurvatus]